MKNKYTAGALILFAALILLAAYPFPFAYAGEPLDIYLVDPADIFVDGGMIYVTDIIDDGKNTAVHQISADLAARTTYFIDGVTEKISVSGINLYVMQKDKVLSFGIDRQSKLLTPGSEISAENVRDFLAVGGKIYILTDTEFIEHNLATKKRRTIYLGMQDTKSISLAGNKIFLLFGDTCMTYTDDEGLSQVDQFPETALHAALVGGYVFYNGESVMDQSGGELLRPEKGIADLHFHTSLLYVLGGDKKITQYRYIDGAFVKVDGFVIGTDKVDNEVPGAAAIRGYTLATATKYPTNILYEASKSSRPAPYTLLTKEDSFLILHYEGMEESKYHYVLFKGSFGWLEKASADITGDNIKVIDTAYKFSGQALTTAYIYSLPFYDDEGTFVIENVPKDTVFNITDRYENLTDTNADWFYVAYEKDGETRGGFVRQTLITNITLNPQTKVKRYTVNTNLTNELGLFTDAALTIPALDEKGEEIKLSSGKQVSVISIDADNAALVQVDIGGKKYIGYLDAARLIEDGLTSYLALGLILGILLILGTAFFVVMAKRRKKHAVAPDEMDPFEAEKTLRKPSGERNSIL